MIGAEIVLSLTLIGSSAADGLSTRAVFQRCVTCRETNPITRGRMLWPMQAVGTTTAIAASHELKRRGKKWWFVPLLAGTGAHLLAARNNHGVGR